MDEEMFFQFGFHWEFFFTEAAHEAVLVNMCSHVLLNIHSKRKTQTTHWTCNKWAAAREKAPYGQSRCHTKRRMDGYSVHPSFGMTPTWAIRDLFHLQWIQNTADNVMPICPYFFWYDDWCLWGPFTVTRPKYTFKYLDVNVLGTNTQKISRLK